MSSIRRYVIELSQKVPRTEEEVFFLNQIPLICRRLNIQQVSLLVPWKKHFPTMNLATAIDSVWGQNALKRLCAGSSVGLPDGVTIRLESIETISEYRSYDMVAAAYLGQKSLDILDSLHARTIVLLPGLDEEGKEWLSMWDAEVLGEEPTWEAAPLQLDPEGEQALESLADKILLYKGLTYSTNKQQVQKMFSNLKKKGLSLPPSGVYIWAVRHDWPPKHARELEKMAAEYGG